MKGYLVAAKIMSGFVVASLIGSPIIAYAGTAGYVGDDSNVFSDDKPSGTGFTWSSDDSKLTLTDDVNGDVVADNDITITTNDDPVTISGKIEVSTFDTSTNADLTIDTANITTGGSISADGDVKITDSSVSADGIIGGIDGKGTDGNVIITDSNVISTDSIAAGNAEQISSHAQGEYGNHNIVINNSNVSVDANGSSQENWYPILAVGGTVTINGSYISSPTDGVILNQGYYGTDIHMGEVGRIVTETPPGGYSYSGAVTITVSTKPYSASTSSNTNSGSSAVADNNDSSSGSSAVADNNDSSSGSSASSDDNNSQEAYVTTTTDYANVYTSDTSNAYFAAVSNNSGSSSVLVKDSNGKLMKVAVDLSSASVPKGYSSKITATIVPALDRNGKSINGLDKIAQALNTAITESGKTPIEGSLFIRAYAAGVSLTKLETPAIYTFTLDKSYEGKTITVYVRTVTGEVHSYDAVVTKGKVQIATEYLGTVAFAM
ncbi:hypothetical protein D6853_03195 [Butyrivibrio sp. X503]|uniref:hypothetical protein n=1 Tax=Butyrivibrio sp. X503 TaxID=2364878 RepID=UPI000EA9B01E|nr:hypothetical protein [Butyrivibrio sp. X503]RKM57038.1 hypothetical protein D6853_03195 [Butyrivibrio sp. X503]